MIRVLHIVGKMHRGGIETLIMELYRRIDRTKVQFDFLCFTHDPGYYDEEIKKMGGRLFYATPRRCSIRKNRKDIYSILKRNNDIQIVHHHMSSCSYITPLIEAKKAGIKYRIAHSHNTNCNGILSNILHKINRFRIKKYANEYFACSTQAGVWMFSKNIWEKGNLLLNGINSKLYKYNPKTREKLRNCLNLSDEFVIGYVGRFEEQKNPIYICEIFAKLSEKMDNVKLLLVGEGSLHAKMDDYLKGKGIFEKVIYVGIVENVYDYLQAMDIFILPSLFEGLGIVAIEAQASDLMTILSDRIPYEAKILNNTIFLPIDKGSDIWVEEIGKRLKSHIVRHDVQNEIISAGYDISSSAKYLENYYLNLNAGEK